MVDENLPLIVLFRKSKRFADIYLPAMLPAIDKKILKFYLWVGVCFFLLGLVYTSLTYPVNFITLLFNHLWSLIYVIVPVYLLFEYSIPFVLKKRTYFISNIFLALLLFFVYLMLFSYVNYSWKLLGAQLHIYTWVFPELTVSHEVARQMGYGMEAVFIFGISRHIYQYVRLRQAEQKLRIEKQEAELNYLKSQTNPHFLFNTLNNIYSLSRDKSSRAPESILQLSKILRYMLYETNGPYVAVEQELKIINDYIALEKLRYDESLRVNFNYDIEDMKQALPPLLLIPMVENAFKHGVSETRSQPYVDIHLSIQRRQLVYVVKNSREMADRQPVKENIGLSNLRRQLELQYKDYDLSVQPGETYFTVVLKINLASHV